MVEGHSVEEDGLTWTLKLRDGLRFHDNEPVLARDVVASIRRFAPRVIFANALMETTDELSAPDDRTVRFRLKRPFPHLPEALAGPGGNVPAIMPERLAAVAVKDRNPTPCSHSRLVEAIDRARTQPTAQADPLPTCGWSGRRQRVI